MADKLIVLITGANQGIGYHAAQQLAADGKYMVLIGSRDLEKGRKAIEAMTATGSVNKTNLEVVQIDIRYDKSIKAAAELVEAKFGRLDILVNNAAISGSELAAQGVSLREQYQTVYNTNVFGQAVCTDTFLPLLRRSTAYKEGKRIIFVSSATGSLTLPSDATFNFEGDVIVVNRSAKSAVNMLSVHYAFVFGSEGFCVGAVYPGFTATNLNRYMGPKDPAVSAQVIVTAVKGTAQDLHGQFVNDEVEGSGYPW